MEVISHRGACFDAPENSLEAFERAIAQGADRIELDVQMTRDGHAVVIHDERTGRVGTPDLEVEFTRLAELRTVHLTNGEPVPTFEEVCRRVAGRVKLDVELKATSDRAAFEVVRLLQRYGLDRDGLITSFDAQVLRRVRTMGWTAGLGLLIGSKSMSLRQRSYEAWPLRGMDAAGADCLVIHHRLLHPPLVKALRSRGDGIYLWTTLEDESRPVAERSRLYQRLRKLPVDGVILSRIPEFRGEEPGA